MFKDNHGDYPLGVNITPSELRLFACCKDVEDPQIWTQFYRWKHVVKNDHNKKTGLL